MIRLLQGFGLRVNRTDPVSLPISRVRAELLGSAEGSWRNGGGESNSLLGHIFHRSFADLFTATHEARWQRALTPELLGDPDILARHIYHELAGPRIMHQQASLQEFSQELLDFWDAVRAMCGWFCGLLRSALEQKLIRYDEVTGYWMNVDMLVRPEEELTWVIRNREWSAPVRIEGRAGAVFRKPGTNRWHVLEYRLGGGSAEYDLLLAVLYHGLLTSTLSGDSNLTLLYFHPELREQMFDEYMLREAFHVLEPVIGRLAGVTAGSPQQQELFTAATERHQNSSQRGAGGEKQPFRLTPPEPHDVLANSVLGVCREFGAEVELSGPAVAGPTFCRYTIEPARGVPAKKVQGLALDLQIRLGLDAPPLITVQGGKLVIDLQRRDRQIVSFDSIRAQIPPSDYSSRLPVGVDIAGAVRFIDLANPMHAHVLVAGSSGSGKTEWLRTAIAGLMMANTPASLRLVLIDPQRTAFGELKDSPFLYMPDALVHPDGIVSPIDMLDALIEEMEARHRAHQRAFVDDLRQYIDKTGDRKARIVCVCDEYADLITGDRKVRKEVELRVSRLGAKARAAGIHLIFATQRPSRDVVSGALQANMTCRVALRTPSAIESRLLLGQGGAEALLGNGDLLFQDTQEPVRLQSALLSEEDRKRIFGGELQPHDDPS